MLPLWSDSEPVQQFYNGVVVRQRALFQPANRVSRGQDVRDLLRQTRPFFRSIDKAVVPDGDDTCARLKRAQHFLMKHFARKTFLTEQQHELITTLNLLFEVGLPVVPRLDGHVYESV